jgi:hypothetical protein
MGEKMSYRVAMDDKKDEEKGYMAINWMQAAGQNGIPAAFIVGKDGKIAWIGHPGGLNAGLLSDVVAGTFDPAKEEAKKKASKERSQAITKAVQKEDWDAALAGLDEMEKAEPEMASMLQSARLHFSVKKGDSAAVVKAGKKLGEGEAAKNPGAMNQASWTILTELKEPSKEAVELAVELAEKGLKAAKDSKAKGADGALLDTLARGQFMKGDKDAAIKSEEQAIAATDDDDTKKGMEESLASYKEGKLPEVKEARPRSAPKKAPKKTD